MFLKVTVSKYVNFILFLIASEVTLDNLFVTFSLLFKCLQEGKSKRNVVPCISTILKSTRTAI